jgi:hypothetical protein
MLSYFSQTRPGQMLEIENLSFTGSILIWLYKTCALDSCMRFYKQPKFSRYKPVSTLFPPFQMYRSRPSSQAYSIICKCRTTLSEICVTPALLMCSKGRSSVSIASAAWRIFNGETWSSTKRRCLAHVKRQRAPIQLALVQTTLRPFLEIKLY